MTSPSLAGSVWYASILGSTFSVVRMARPWVSAVMLQEGCITVFHPGSTCSRCCFTSTFLNTRSFWSDGGDKGLAIYKVKFIYPCGTLWPSYILMPLLLPGVFLHLFLVEAPAFLLACRTATSCAVTAPPRRPPGPSLDTRPANTDMAAGSVMKSKHK